jgi:hypothetical protein
MGAMGGIGIMGGMYDKISRGRLKGAGQTTMSLTGRVSLDTAVAEISCGSGRDGTIEERHRTGEQGGFIS